jgi:hypothetical protein
MPLDEIDQRSKPDAWYPRRGRCRAVSPACLQETSEPDRAATAGRVLDLMGHDGEAVPAE